MNTEITENEKKILTPLAKALMQKPDENEGYITLITPEQAGRMDRVFIGAVLFCLGFALFLVVIGSGSAKNVFQSKTPAAQSAQIAPVNPVADPR